MLWAVSRLVGKSKGEIFEICIGERYAIPKRKMHGQNNYKNKEQTQSSINTIFRMTRPTQQSNLFQMNNEPKRVIKPTAVLCPVLISHIRNLSHRTNRSRNRLRCLRSCNHTRRKEPRLQLQTPFSQQRIHTLGACPPRSRNSSGKQHRGRPRILGIPVRSDRYPPSCPGNF